MLSNKYSLVEVFSNIRNFLLNTKSGLHPPSNYIKVLFDDYDSDESTNIDFFNYSYLMNLFSIVKNKHVLQFEDLIDFIEFALNNLLDELN